MKNVRDGVIMALMILIITLWVGAAVIAPAALIKYCWRLLVG